MQSQALDESRSAMYSALQVSRGHSGKHRITAKWYPDIRQARVDPPARGLHFQTIGKADSRGNVWLNQEELLYLVERGSLECFWLNEPGPPMSLQAVYAAVFGNTTIRKNSCEIERYQVYSYLKRLGFIVQRAPTYEDVSNNNQLANQGNPQHFALSLLDTIKHSTVSILRNLKFLIPAATFLKGIFHDVEKSRPFKNFVGYGNIFKHNAINVFRSIFSPENRKIFHSYKEIYKSLDFIPCNEPPKTANHLNKNKEQLPTESTALFRVIFHVWKPRPNFSKKSPGTPDFFISVIDTKEFNVPTLEQTLSLLDNVHVKGYKIKNPVKNNDKSQKVRGLTIPQQMNLLKRGYRNIIIAAVDSGIINMTSVADVPFGQEHVYYPYN